MLATLLLAAAATIPQSPCIGQSLDNCIASIKLAYSIDDDEIAKELKRLDQRDVNGNPIWARRLINTQIWKDARLNFTMATIELNNSNNVKSVTILLRGAPISARTETEYDQTGLYDAMRVLLPSECWGGEKMTAYRWFENSVKPKIIREPVKREITANQATEEYYQHSPDIPFCGQHVSTSYLFGNDTQQITLDNPHGSFGSADLVVSDTAIDAK